MVCNSTVKMCVFCSLMILQNLSKNSIQGLFLSTLSPSINDVNTDTTLSVFMYYLVNVFNKKDELIKQQIGVFSSLFVQCPWVP